MLGRAAAAAWARGVRACRVLLRGSGVGGLGGGMGTWASVCGTRWWWWGGGWGARGASLCIWTVRAACVYCRCYCRLYLLSAAASGGGKGAARCDPKGGGGDRGSGGACATPPHPRVGGVIYWLIIDLAKTVPSPRPGAEPAAFCVGCYAVSRVRRAGGGARAPPPCRGAPLTYTSPSSSSP